MFILKINNLIDEYSFWIYILFVIKFIFNVLFYKNFLVVVSMFFFFKFNWDIW